MAHGNSSDLAFLLLLIGAIVTWAKPELLFEPPFPLEDEGVGGLVTLSGGLAFQLGMTLSGVKWNPVNGKMGGFGAFCAVANAVLLGNSTGQKFFYGFAAALLLGAVHIFLRHSNTIRPDSVELLTELERSLGAAFADGVDDGANLMQHRIDIHSASGKCAA